MASHEELITELQKLEKLSHAARLKHARKRRLKQLKKYQDWLRFDRQTAGTVLKKKSTAVIGFEDSAVLNDLVSRNDLIGVSKLLEHGADPNICNADGLTPLHKCCIDDTLDMAEVILEHRVDLNARDIEGWTPLHAASATGNIQMINMLIDRGANLVGINNEDKMPVDVAADGDIRYVLQQKMIEAGYTEDVLEYIRVSVPKTMLADIKDSVRNDRSLNVQDKYGTSALHIAAANGYTEVIDFLLAEEEVDLNIADNEGWTPFHAAVCWNQPDMMRKLAEKGADMDIKNLRGETPYVIAEDPEVRQLILELKGQYGQSQEVSLEDRAAEEEEGFEHKPRPRRMSVKRISQQAKEELAKQSVQEEVSMRKQSMVKHDLEMSQEGKLFDKAVSDEVAGDEDDEAAIVLVRMKSFSVANEASKDIAKQVSVPEDAGDSTPLIGQRNHKEEGEGGKDSTACCEPENNVNSKSRKTDRPARFSVQQEPFSKTREPRKSVLKKTPHAIARAASTYDSTTSPPSSPLSLASGSSAGSNGTKSPPVQQDRKCCVVM